MEILNYKSKISFKGNSQQNINSKNNNNNSNEQNLQTKLAKTPIMGLISFSSNGVIPQQMKILRTKVANIHKTGVEHSLLSWEEHTGNPTDERRKEIANRKAELALTIKKKSTSPRIGNVLGNLKDAKGLNRVEQAIVREAQREYDEGTKIPDEFTDSMSKLESTSYPAWAKARKENKYEDFAGSLTEIIQKSREKAAYLSPEKQPYDVLLDTYEPDLTVKKLDKLFGELKEEVVPLVKQVQKKVEANPELHEFEFLNRPIDPDKAKEFCMDITKDMGFDFNRGEVALSAHPFTSPIDSNQDVRFTLRDPSLQPPNPDGTKKPVTVETLVDMISVTMHECGHALVEQGGDDSINRTGLTGASTGLHESQSRLWEKQVGKSMPFWKHYYPKLQKKVPQLQDVKLDDFYRAINTVKPGMIRVEADEATYDSHVMLRYDLEKDMMDPKKDVEDVVKKLPQKWDQKMEEYLGVKPETDSEGVLQDIHWSVGYVGYFPGYTIGNVASAQIYNAAKKDLKTKGIDLEKQLEKGDLKTLKNWLQEKMYKNGKTDMPDQILKNVTGEELNPKYYTNYLKNKYTKIYDL